MMSQATDGYLVPRGAVRPVGLIAGIAALELLTFVLAGSSQAGGLSAAVPWMVLDFYLLRKIWRGSSTAWTLLVVLDIGVVVLCALTLFQHNLHVEGGPFVVVRLALELALLVAPGMRRWVAQN